MSERRWIKFWPQDWHGDKALRTCSIGARGMWMELICMAHEGTPYGHVTINGKGATIRQIASIAGVTEKEAVKLLQELDEAGVFSRTEEGVILSRRMVKDREASLQGKEFIAKRWGGKGDDQSPIGEPSSPPNRGPTDTPNTLEARSKKQEATEEKQEAPPEATPHSRGTRLSPDWVPSPSDAQFAKGLGLDVQSVTERFRDYWCAQPGKGGVKLDWSATWRNKCRSDAERLGKPNSRGSLFPAPDKHEGQRRAMQEMGLYGDQPPAQQPHYPTIDQFPEDVH